MPKAPTDDEMAAIIVAVDEVWPRPSVEDGVVNTADVAWKFANRWWRGSNNLLNRNRPRRPGQFS